MAVIPDTPTGSLGAINIFTFTPTRWRWWRQRLGFWTSRLAQWRARSYSGRELGSITLRRLDILHTATWVRVGRFPATPGVPREAMQHVLFCSNFAGEWDPYRQAFLDVVGGGVKSMWGRSVGFPKFPRPGSRYELEEWQRHRLPKTAHYYRAYPGLAPGEIRSAVRLSRELEAFALNAPYRWPDDPDDQGTGLVRAFDQLQRRLEAALGASRSRLVPGAVLGPPTATGMSNVVSLVPITAGREDDVLERILELPPGDTSPFRSVPGTHFARLAVLDRRTAGVHADRLIELRNSWLLLAVDFDGYFGVHEARERRMDPGEFRRYADAIDGVVQLRNVWRDCAGFDDRRPLSELLVPSVITRFVLFLDHGDTTLREIDHALRTKDRYQRALTETRFANEAAVRALLDALRADVATRTG